LDPVRPIRSVPKSEPPDIDWFEETAKLRREMRNGRDPEYKLEWLDDLDRMNRELNANVFRSSCIDNSPVTAFTRAPETLREGESWVDGVQRMMNDGFDAIHEMLQEEGRLLEERSSLLAQIQETLVEHACDYTADLDNNDEELEMDSMQSRPPVELRPRTAPRRRT
jgi:hypothetical protein